LLTARACALGLVFSLVLSGPVELLHKRGVVSRSASAAILLPIVLGGGSGHRRDDVEAGAKLDYQRTSDSSLGRGTSIG
jgi:hypothetical protein